MCINLTTVDNKSASAQKYKKQQKKPCKLYENTQAGHKDSIVAVKPNMPSYNTSTVLGGIKEENEGATGNIRSRKQSTGNVSNNKIKFILLGGN
jgi:hypothetical protein